MKGAPPEVDLAKKEWLEICAIFFREGVEEMIEE